MGLMSKITDESVENIKVIIRDVAILLDILTDVCKTFHEFVVKLTKLGDDGLQKKVKEEIQFIRNKLDDINKKIHCANSDGIIRKLNYFAVDKNKRDDADELIKEFNSFIFDIKKSANECQEKLAIIKRRVNDFLSNRKKNWTTGVKTAVVGGGLTSGFGGLGIAAAILTVSNPVTLGVTAIVGTTVGVTTLITGSTVAAANRDTGNEKIEELKDAQVTMQHLQSNLEDVVAKLKGHIDAFKHMNVFVADF